MKLNSTALGIIILVIFFGSIAASASVGWWQTEGPGGQNHSQGGEHTLSTLQGRISEYDTLGIRIVMQDGQAVYVKLGNSRHSQSIGFVPSIGESVTVNGFTEDGGTFNAVSVTLDRTGQVFTFRTDTGQPLWTGSGQH